jgi:hypothetical protein
VPAGLFCDVLEQDQGQAVPFAVVGAGHDRPQLQALRHPGPDGRVRAEQAIGRLLAEHLGQGPAMSATA